MFGVVVKGEIEGGLIEGSDAGTWKYPGLKPEIGYMTWRIGWEG